MTQSFIPDVSEYQPNVDADKLKAAGYLAIIARVAYGTTPDRIMPARRDYLRARMPIIGWYLFFRHAVSWQSQLATFTSIIPSLGAYEFAVVDWERDTDGSLPPVADRDALLAGLAAHYNRRPWLYGPASLLASNPAPAGDPEWPAAYGQGDPNLPGEKLWQYTDGRYTSGGYAPVNFPGIGLCDASVFNGSYAQLETLIAGTSTTQGARSPMPGMLNNCVGFDETPDGKGYWLATADGGVFTHGDAGFHGSAYPAPSPIVSFAARPQGDGYWLLAKDGGIYSYGAAKMLGNLYGKNLAEPPVALRPTSSGNGYWVVCGDGGVMPFGDAGFFGAGA